MTMILQLQHFISLASVVTSYSFQKLDSDHTASREEHGIVVHSESPVSEPSATKTRGQKVRVREP
jgi:hypothetical protein